jgi:hypothetical protein
MASTTATETGMTSAEAATVSAACVTATAVLRPQRYSEEKREGRE